MEVGQDVTVCRKSQPPSQYLLASLPIASLSNPSLVSTCSRKEVPHSVSFQEEAE